jgi:hypothetical protein
MSSGGLYRIDHFLKFADRCGEGVIEGRPGGGGSLGHERWGSRCQSRPRLVSGVPGEGPRRGKGRNPFCAEGVENPGVAMPGWDVPLGGDGEVNCKAGGRHP